ncbi:MAG TPA: hypothetical protein VMR21_02005, partial [Vicinamibacteria bacterium]|nr:hypothetical protein [Vicinamibacteria bacterium]
GSEAGGGGGRGRSGGAAKVAADGGGGRQGEGEGGQPATVFVLGPDARPSPQPIRTGITDGQFVEVVRGLEDGTQVITGSGPGMGTRPSGPQPSGSGSNPFNPQRPQRRQRG